LTSVRTAARNFDLLLDIAAPSTSAASFSRCWNDSDNVWRQQGGLCSRSLQASYALAPIGLSSFDGRFEYGRIVHWKADRPKRILGTCPNRVIDLVGAARFMTAASTS
jgi:hypothetical protein